MRPLAQPVKAQVPRPPGHLPTVRDAEIIKASQDDPEQFAVLFERHAQLIHRYIARRAGREFADDLTAETFLAAFRRRDRYQAGYPDAIPWLYGIATNLISQHRRDGARQVRIRLAAIPEQHDADHGDQVAGDVTARAVRSVLAAALADLPGADRDVLVLIAWEQLTYDEVARALDIPIGTVRSRLSRARKRIRKALARTEHSATFREILTDE